MDECASVEPPIVSAPIAALLSSNPLKYGAWSSLTSEEHFAITVHLRTLPAPQNGVAHVVSQLEGDGMAISSDDEAWIIVSSKAAAQSKGPELAERQAAAAAVWKDMMSTWDDFLSNWDR